VEDGLQQSLAGHFWSSPAVDAANLPATIAQAWAKNTAVLATLGLAVEPMVMVQTYIEHQIGGVLFAPWGFFADYALVEVGDAGVHAAVAGHSTPAVIALDSDHAAPLALPAALAYLELPLRDMARQLRQTFAFPLDVEWAYCPQRAALVVLQVRPQTRMVGAVKTLPESLKPALPPGKWTYGALSESLGAISPLSFSVLQQLYTDSIPTLRNMGCKAQQVDFLLHFPDGTVLVDAQREQAFFQLSTFGGFWRGLRTPALQQASRALLATWHAATPFAYSTLAQLFSHWLLDNLLTQGAERSVTPPAHAYELMWNVPLPALPAANLTLRQAFFGEWGKLKQQLATQAVHCMAFCTWDEYQRGETAAAQARQHACARAAVYDHSSVALHQHVDSGMRLLAARKAVTGRALVVQQPGHFHGEFPLGCILIAPYFDNCWVAQLQRCAGVIVMQGGMLSHAALVARELGIPYCVVDAGLVEGIKDGEQVTLDPLTQTLRYAGKP
jgi:phosphohistidine swiveling domain-containing protein